MKKYKVVFCAGTFDVFHKGHEAIIRKASSVGDKVVLGVMSDAYVLLNKHDMGIEPFEERKKTVEKFIKKEKITSASVISIEDALEPAASDDTYSAIMVSENTKSGAEKVNEKRSKNNLPSLDIIVVRSVKAQDGDIISSSRIRNGEINRNGRSYVKKEWLDSTLVVSSNLKESLKKPYDTLFTNAKDFLGVNKKYAQQIITVGDVCTALLNQHNWNHPISVIDFIVGRKKVYSRLADLGFKGREKIITVENEAGTIHGRLFTVIKEVFSNRNKRIIIKIAGEEDLTVLPFLLCAPLGWFIVYGQPGEGMVLVRVSEKNKEKAYDFVSQLKTL